MVEVPVQYRDRPAGSLSKLNTVKDGIKILKTIFILFKEYRPKLFFGIITIISFLLTIGFSLPTIIYYIKSKIVKYIALLILSGIFLFISIVTYVTGVILSVIAKKSKQNYELMMNIIAKK